MHSKQHQPQQQAAHNAARVPAKLPESIHRPQPFHRAAGNQTVRRMLHAGAVNGEAAGHHSATSQSILALRAAEAVRGPGMPLPPAIENEATRRYGHSFTSVRIHTDAPASDAARSLRASAFTLGNDIAFSSNRYNPRTLKGQLLLQHELRHVAQQRSAQPVSSPQIDPHHSRHELEAREIFNPHVEPLSVQRVQCAPEDEQYSIGSGFKNDLGEAVFGPRAWPFVKAVIEGFVGGLKADVKSGRADAAVDHLSGLLWPKNMVKFAGGYLVGLVYGFFSPIVDLVNGIIGIVRFGVAAAEWLAKWSPMGIAISPERQQKIRQVFRAFSELADEWHRALGEFAMDPEGTIERLSGFLSDMMQTAVGHARKIGSSAAHSIFEFLELGYYDMGKSMGKVIGWAIAQVLMVIFTGTIGNFITKGFSILGKLGKLVSGQLVAAFEFIGSFISDVVKLLRTAVRGALKLFKPLIDKASEAFAALKAIFTDAAATVQASHMVAAAGDGPGMLTRVPSIMEMRMVKPVRTTTATVADLRPAKVHPSNVGKSPTPPPKKPALGKAPFDEPLTEAEKKLTPEQLRQKHILESMDEKQRAARGAAKEETTAGHGRQATGKVGAGMKAKPKHHVLPQEHRQWFEDHGFRGKWDIDRFTVELDEAAHQAIHGGGNYRLGRTTGFEWNTTVMNELNAAQHQLGGRLLSRTQVWAIVQRLMSRYQIPKKFIPYR